MTDFTVIDAKAFHCGAMVRMLRHQHQQAVAKMGFNSHKELRSRFDASSFRRAWFIDGRLAALGGVTGSMLAPEGHVWLAFSEMATRYPLQMVKESRRQLAEIGQTKHRLFTAILDDDVASKRFAVFLGFVPEASNGMQSATSRYGRRDILRRAEESRMAGGHGIAMIYEPRAA